MLRVLPAALGRFLVPASARPCHQPQARRRIYRGQPCVGMSSLQCLERKRYIGSLDPSTGRFVRLFHPRQDRWEEHFRLAGVLIEPLTPEAVVTTRLLRLNIDKRVVER